MFSFFKFSAINKQNAFYKAIPRDVSINRTLIECVDINIVIRCVALCYCCGIFEA